MVHRSLFNVPGDSGASGSVWDPSQIRRSTNWNNMEEREVVNSNPHLCGRKCRSAVAENAWSDPLPVSGMLVARTEFTLGTGR